MSMENDSEVLSVEDQLVLKHRKEKKELQAKIQALKKTATKGDKKKRKEVLDEITKLEANLQNAHAVELANAESSKEVETITDEVEDIALEAGPKISKAQKRRNKKDVANKEREQRIVEQEIENENSLRNIETQAISGKLEKKGLMIYEIPSDGDCLYAAIDKGLKDLGCEPLGTSNLRRLTGDFIKNNPEEFMPFLCDLKTGDPLSEEQLVDYCDKISSTCQWGGQVELGALTRVIEKALVIVQADGPEIVMGEEHKQSGQIVLTYHRHMYRLGEHYNSVQPFAPQTADL